MPQSIARVILTLNQKYCPTTAHDVYGFGVVGFTIAVATALASQNQLAGVLLYHRDEDILTPFVLPSSYLGFPAVQVRFNFRMSDQALRVALTTALEQLMMLSVRLAPPTGAVTPLVYHQTNTLIPFMPDNWPFVITHHGPFATEICERFGEDFAADAFNGGAEKVRHLIRAQRRGLDALRRSKIGAALELSRVQTEVLMRAKIPPRRIFRAAPPIEGGPTDQFTSGHRSPVARQRDRQDTSVTSGLHILSAASRLDRFKNFPQIIQAAAGLTMRGLPVRVSLIAGDENDGLARAALLAEVPENLRAHITLQPRVPHPELLQRFKQSNAGTIFVCSSLYETLCITALEAALSGVRTLVPSDLTRIGAAQYLPPYFRYDATTECLISKLHDLYTHPKEHPGTEIRDYVKHQTGFGTFMREWRAAADFVCAMAHGDVAPCYRSLPQAPLIDAMERL